MQIFCVMWPQHFCSSTKRSKAKFAVPWIMTKNDTSLVHFVFVFSPFLICCPLPKLSTELPLSSKSILQHLSLYHPSILQTSTRYFQSLAFMWNEEEGWRYCLHFTCICGCKTAYLQVLYKHLKSAIWKIRSIPVMMHEKHTSSALKYTQFCRGLVYTIELAAAFLLFLHCSLHTLRPLQQKRQGYCTAPSCALQAALLQKEDCMGQGHLKHSCLTKSHRLATYLKTEFCFFRVYN